MDKNPVSGTLDASQIRLQQADLDCIRVLQSWFKSAASLYAWGGPGLCLEVTAEQFAQQIELHEVSSYSMLDTHDNLLGFGQVYRRFDRAHLGRIGINPDYRGLDLGKQLVSKLIKYAYPLSRKGVSLFVLKDNIAAIKCYQSLGFLIADYPQAQADTYDDMWFMLRQETLSID